MSGPQPRPDIAQTHSEFLVQASKKPVSVLVHTHRSVIAQAVHCCSFRVIHHSSSIPLNSGHGPSVSSPGATYPRTHSSLFPLALNVPFYHRNMNHPRACSPGFSYQSHCRCSVSVLLSSINVAHSSTFSLSVHTSVLLSHRSRLY